MPRHEKCVVSKSYIVHKDDKRNVCFNVIFHKNTGEIKYCLRAVIGEQDIHSPHYDVQGEHRIDMGVDEVSYLAIGDFFQTPTSSTSKYGNLKFTMDSVKPRCIYVEYTFEERKHPIPIRLTHDDYENIKLAANIVLTDLNAMKKYLQKWDGKERRVVHEKGCLWRLIVAYCRSHFQFLTRKEQTMTRATEILQGVTLRGFHAFLQHNALSIPHGATIENILSLNRDILSEIMETASPPTYEFFIHNSLCDICSQYIEYDLVFSYSHQCHTI